MKRFLLLLVVSLVISITAYLYPWLGLKIISDAFATGGAFIYSKHGGATTDGFTPCAGGVNRGLGIDYVGGTIDPCNTLPGSGSYNTANPEAGTYGSGECLHCHEPMASFGGGEPHPNTTSNPADVANGPSAYLLFKGDYNSATNGANSELCWYCHENQVNINNSNSPRGKGRWSFYQGKDVFQLSTHFDPTLGDGTGQFYWPGTTVGTQIWPRQNRSALPNSNRGSCLNCHTPHGIKAADASTAYDTVTSDTWPGGTGGVPAARQTTATNPSVMENYLIPRQLIAWEENLCEACHSPTGPSSKNVRDEINKRYPVGGAGSGHPVDAVTDPSNPAVYLTGQHTVMESIPLTSGAWNEAGRPVTLKHVECYDCHNPHAVKKGGNTPGIWDDGGRLKGMRYITINGTVCDPVSPTNPAECTTITIGNNTFTKTSAQPFIYELCFKCHGDSYASFIPDKTSTGADNNPLRTTVLQDNCNATRTPASSCTDGSNKRLEFNPTTQTYSGFGPFDVDKIPTNGSGDTTNRDTTNNKAFHPVATPGRNTSLALCYQLKARGFPNLDCTETSAGSGLVSSLANLTIYCTDCHNTNAAGTGTFTTTGGGNPTIVASPNFPGPITESALRPTDVASTVPAATVVGPHGSTNPRILRADYNTQFATFTQFDPANFALCFQCHNEEPFYRDDGTALVDGIRRRATNFYQNTVGAGLGSLHAFHLRNRTKSSCINCHYNIHSNYEQAHTQFGMGAGVSLPPDRDTHLINFSPEVQNHGLTKPAWFLNGSYMGCNLTCHNQNMDGGGGGGGRDARYEVNPS